MTNPRALAKANQRRYHSAQTKIRHWMEDRDIVPIQSEIIIYPEYPDTWEAVVAAWDRVWIFRVVRGEIRIRDIQHVRGFRPNGALIFS